MAYDDEQAERVRDRLGLARPRARPAVKGARTMRGWVRAAGAGLNDATRDCWIKTALTYSTTLPGK
ncbi:hypothetical protein [Streptomyces sp. 6N223]|uniref:hypothetical protein n=1 Tax=Streptomyces sp. 6N223 TaxID=3457412 RepID=UPI003FD1E015